MKEKHFYSIEYVDPEGELCVDHALLTESEAAQLMGLFVSHGVQATMNRLSRTREESLAVISADEQRRPTLGQGERELELPPPGRD